MNVKNRGFTLIELLVTLAVAVFLLTVGVPTVQALLNSSEKTTKINELITSLNVARSEALKQGTTISLCRKSSTDDTLCSTKACNADTHSDCWESGWLIFSDDNNSGSKDAGEALLKTYSFESSRHSLVTNEYPDSITFGSSGDVNLAGKFTYCVDWNNDGDYLDTVDSANWVAVILNMTGRPKLSTDINNDGIHDDQLGNSLKCL